LHFDELKIVCVTKVGLGEMSAWLRGCEDGSIPRTRLSALEGGVVVVTYSMNECGELTLEGFPVEEFEVQDK
jgi:hypothetical protein